MIRVLLVQHARLVRGAFAALLSREDATEVVAEADGDGDVVARALACRPDVPVIDVAVIDVDSRAGEEIAVRGELRERLPECRLLPVMAAMTPERLCLSAATVRNHLSAITRTTGGRTRIDAIRIATESGWV
ncbi:response regulator transcription factor [Streptomyces sp. NPDC086081]|uniref:response regulator transcription factor n=1 Tax=Streptomyces sp. NPDC086081 TaxID=3365749 RepID=UPI0038049B6D